MLRILISTAIELTYCTWACTCFPGIISNKPTRVFPVLGGFLMLRCKRH